jgi:hypothetical protein
MTMSTEPQPEPNVAETSPSSAPGPVKKKGVSPARNAIGIVALVVASVLAFFEVSAAVRSRAAIDRLESAVTKNEQDLMSPDEVAELLGRAADGPIADPQNDPTQTFTWSGILRKHQIVATYTRGTVQGLLKYETR